MAHPQVVDGEDSQQGVVLQLGGLGVGLQLLTVKISLLRKITRSLGPGRIPWINDLSER
jgi:hypothetical protein